MNLTDKIYVAGHRGMVGSALVRRLQQGGFTNLVLKTHAELDLTDGAQVRQFFETEKPDHVFLAAAKVGGIWANQTQKGEFIHTNLLIQTHVIHESWRAGVQKLLYMGSSCIYPKLCPQPIDESFLMTGHLEPTNDAYAVAKIAGIQQCRAYNQQYGTSFLSVMPTNLYGPGDTYDLENAHVLPALLRKCHEAKQAGSPTLTVWGSGKPFREFLHVDDLADAAVFLMGQPMIHDLINIGTGQDLSILDLAKTIQRVVGYSGTLVFDASKPDGTPKKQLNVDKLHALGWRHRIGLEEGLRRTYQDYLATL